MKTKLLIFLLLPSLGGTLAAEQMPPSGSSEVVSYDEVTSAQAPDIIFSNLDLTPGDRYNVDAPFPIAGKDALAQTEASNAVLFVPKVDVRAKELFAAIAYISGTKLVNLGIYSNNEDTGSVGTVLVGGQGSITQMPSEGTCCQLAKVTLAGDGVLLTAGTRYWLVASPDNVNAPTFNGTWRGSNQAIDAQLVGVFPWGTNAGQWPAAQIRGRKVQSLQAIQTGKKASPPRSDSTRDGSVTIFTNLDSISTDRYDSSEGISVTGNDAPPEPEVWSALPFTPRANVHAVNLGAAVSYLSGTKKVNLGIYADNDGVPGALLPGGQASTTDIPNFRACCDLTQVTLPGAGVALTKGTRYWLVASPDDVSAPDFNGLWSPSNLAVDAFEEPENFEPWTNASGFWLAARIEGTSP